MIHFFHLLNFYKEMRILLPSVNANANPNNALQLHRKQGVDRVESKQGVKAHYSPISIDLTTYDDISQVIAGKGGSAVKTISLSRNFSVYANSEVNFYEIEKLFKDLEAKLISELDYRIEGFYSYSVSGTTLTITLDWTDMILHSIGDGTTDYVFNCTDAEQFGPNDQISYDAKAKIEVSGDNLIVTPFGTYKGPQGDISRVVINDGTADVYDGDLSVGTSGDATVATTNNVKTITIDESGASTVLTYTITVYVGPDEKSFVQLARADWS